MSPKEYAFSRQHLKARTASSFVFNIAARSSSVVIQIATTAILARLLLPEDFGLVGMVTPAVAAFTVFGNLGFTSAVLQRERLTSAQLSSLFYANLAMSGVLALALAAIAPALAAFYKTPQVAPIALLLSVAIFASGLSSLQSSLIQRDLKFKIILIGELLAQLGASAIAIAIALGGGGFMALAARPVAQAVIFTAVVWTGSGWRPGKPEWSSEVRSLFSFGGYSVGFGLFNMLGRNSDNVLIGWRYGQAELGPYALAYRLFMWPVQMVTQPIGAVILPALSRLWADPERLSRWYLSVIRLINLIVAPLTCALEICAGDVVRVFLGEKWLVAVPIIRWLLPVAALRVTSTTIGWLMLAHGRADRQFRWAAIAVPVYLLSFFIGLQWRAVGVAAAFALANALLFVPGFAYGAQGTGVRLSKILLALVPGLVSSAAVLLALVALSAIAAFPAPGARLVIAALVAPLVMMASVFAIFGVRRTIDESKRFGALVLSQRAAS